MGWVGAALAFLALAVIGFTTDDPVKVRGAYLPDGAGGVVSPRSVGACIAAQRNRLVAGHDVGAVSVLLGRLEAGHNGVRDRHSADLHGDVPGDGRESRQIPWWIWRLFETPLRSFTPSWR